MPVMGLSGCERRSIEESKFRFALIQFLGSFECVYLLPVVDDIVLGSGDVDRGVCYKEMYESAGFNVSSGL
jgi:hypothetical protein